MYGTYSMYSIYSMYCTVCTVQYVQYVPSTKYARHNILTNIGHRFGHQSGVYKSSGQNSAAISIAYSFRVSLVFSKICINSKHQSKYIFLSKTDMFEKGASLFKKEKRLRQACSAVNRAWGYQFI